MFDRIKASLIHFSISLVIVSFAAGWVFLILYPGLLASISNVNDIFALIVLVDVCLGPLITLVIFNKKKKELKFDLAVVGLVQIAALSYGLHTLFIARPAYIVFNASQFDLVYANDFDRKAFVAAELPFKSLPVWGPKIVAAEMPKDEKLAAKIVLLSLTEGKELQVMPEYYENYSDAEITSKVIEFMTPIKKLKEYNPKRIDDIDQLIAKYQKNGTVLGFYPFYANSEALTAIIDGATGAVLAFEDFRAK